MEMKLRELQGDPQGGYLLPKQRSKIPAETE